MCPRCLTLGIRVFKQKCKVSAYLGTRRLNEKLLYKKPRNDTESRGTLYQSILGIFQLILPQKQTKIEEGWFGSAGG